MYKSIQEFVEKSSKEFYEELNMDRLIVKTEEIVRELGRNSSILDNSQESRHEKRKKYENRELVKFPVLVF